MRDDRTKREVTEPAASGVASAARASKPRIRETTVELDIPFHDVDALKIVWHGHYYKYYEIARTELMRSCKLDIPDVIDLGNRMLVIESHSRYISPLAYGDRARVTAWLEDVVHRIHVRYEIENLTTGRRAARGHTMLVATNREGTMLHRTPDGLQERLLGMTSAPDPSED